MTTKATLGTGGALLLLGVALWWHTASFPTLDAGYPGPSLFPRLIALGLAGCGVVLMMSTRRLSTNSKNESLALPGIARLLGGVAAVSLYPLLHEVIGFVPAIALLIAGIGLMLRASIPWLVGCAIGGSGLLYLVFTYGLGVPL